MNIPKERLCIYCFGGFKVELDGNPITTFSTEKTRALLVYLAVEQDHAFQRSFLSGLLWSDQSETQALHSLRQTISILRKALNDTKQEDSFLITDRDLIQINPNASIWVDVIEFRKTLKDAYQHNKQRNGNGMINYSKLQKAMSIFQGVFLERYRIAGSSLFEEWAILMQEETNKLAIEALTHLQGYYQRRAEESQIIECLERIIKISPWDENAHYELLLHLAADQQWSAAEHHFKSLQNYLSHQLGVKPNEKINQLFNLIHQHNSAAIHSIYEPKAPAHNLSPTQSEFIGRTAEVEELIQIVCDPHCRLITLTGTGGIGKTRLATELAHQMIGQFKDGVFFISIPHQKTLEQFQMAIGKQIDLAFSASLNPGQQLLDYFRSRQILLVLDNVDTFLNTVEVVSFIADLLTSIHTIKMIATSRERLNLQQERIFLLEGLAFPQVMPANPEGLTAFDAIKLFLKNVQQRNRHFTMDRSNAIAILQFCQRIEGHPLAIELAATSLLDTPNSDLHRLAQTNLSALNNSITNADPLQKNLQAVFEISWQHLSREMQTILSRVSIFRGGFTCQSAAEICQQSEINLQPLINKSLIKVRNDERYTLHEIIRELSLVKLAGEGCLDEVKDLHSHYYYQQVSHCRNSLKGRDQVQTLDWLDLELENISQAWNWLLIQKKYEYLQDMVDPLYQFYNIRSRFQEGIDSFQESLQKLETEKEGALLSALLAARIGALALRARRTDLVQSAINTSLQLLSPFNMLKEVAFCKVTLGGVYLRKRNMKAALESARESQALYRQSADVSGEAYAAYLEGLVQNTSGLYEEAKVALLHSISLSIQIEDQRRLIGPYNVLGDIACIAGDYNQAEYYFKEGIEISRKLKDRFNLGMLLNNLATVHQIRKQFAEEEAVLQESMAICHEIGDRSGETLALNNLGEMANIQSDFDKAITFCNQALEMALSLEDDYITLICYNTFAEAYLGKKDYHVADHYFQKAICMALDIEAMDMVSRIAVNYAPVFHHQKKPQIAVQLTVAALAHSSLEDEFRQKAMAFLEASNVPVDVSFNDRLLPGVVRSLVVKNPLPA